MTVEILYCINLIAIALYGLIWYARAQKYLKGWNESLESQKSKIEQLKKLYEMNIKLLHEKRELEKEIRDQTEMVKKFNDCIVSLSEKNKEIIELRYKIRELKFELNKVNNNEKTKNYKNN